MAISGVISQIRTTNLDESLDFYVTKLGLELEFKHEDFYAGVKAGEQSFHIKLVDERDPSIDFVSDGDHLHLYFTTDDLKSNAAEFERQGITFTKKIHKTAWESIEFYIQDNQGHTLCFGQRQ